MASSLEKSLKKLTHRLAGLEHKEFDEEHAAKWQFKPLNGESMELLLRKKLLPKKSLKKSLLKTLRQFLLAAKALPAKKSFWKFFQPASANLTS